MHILGGRYRHFKLQCPTSHVRPTSSQLRAALFNICQTCIEGAHFLDVFAGSGAMGLEALSRGATSATLMEQDRNALTCIRNNISKMQVGDSACLLPGDALLHLQRLSKKGQTFSIIYVDPPYDQRISHEGRSIPLSHKALYLIDQMGLLSPQGTLFVETSKMEIPASLVLEHLQLKECRRYGTTILSEFVSKA